MHVWCRHHDLILCVARPYSFWDDQKAISLAEVTLSKASSALTMGNLPASTR